jgi:hypothetical protein
MTIKGPFKQNEHDIRELETIRPIRNKPEVKPATSAKPHSRKYSGTNSQRPRTSGKDKAGTKFTIPPRPANVYREQSVEDYSDILMENENLFDRRLNLIKVSIKNFLCDIY